MASYDFVTADKFGKYWLTHCLRIWIFSGLNLAPRQKVDLVTLSAVEVRCAVGWIPCSELVQMGFASG